MLGSGGWIPTNRRETCSALFRSGDRAILIDAGTGLGRLVDEDLLEGVEELSLVLTHFHLDHIAALGCLEGLLPSPIPLYAPAEMLYGSKSEEVVRTFISPPYLSAPFSNTFSAVYELCEENTVSGFSVFAREQKKHSLSTAALRIEDEMVYLTDTSYDAGNISFASGAKVMFHEAWYVQGEEESETHSSGREAGEIAAASGVEELYLIHANPFGNEEKVLEDARAAFPAAQMAFDGQRISGE